MFFSLYMSVFLAFIVGWFWRINLFISTYLPDYVKEQEFWERCREDLQECLQVSGVKIIMRDWDIRIHGHILEERRNRQDLLEVSNFQM